MNSSQLPRELGWVEKLPQRYRVARLGSVANPVKQRNIGNRNTDLLSLSYGNIISKDIESVDGLLPESFETYNTVEPGDVVFRLTDLQNDKRSLRTGLVKQSGIITSAYVSVRPVAIEARYLAYFMRAMDLAKVFYSLGGGLRQSLNYAEAKLLPVVLPPEGEQRAIADYLDRETAEIDAFISDQQAFRHLLIERWVSGLVNIVQPQLLEQDSLHSPKLRPSWTRTRLKSTVESDKNGSWGSDEGVDQVTRRCIRVADFDKHSGRIHSRSETNRSYPIDQASSLALKAGDLLIEKSGGGPTSPVGNVVLYTGPGGDLYSNFVARIRLQAGIDPRFALYLHRALYLSGVTNRSIKQTTGIQNLDSSSYFNETVWLPSPEEQKVLGQRVEAQRDFIDETLKDVDLSIRLAEERRGALISAAVTGQIDVVSHGVSAAERLQDELEVHV